MNPIVFASTYIAFGFGPVFIGRIVITILVAVTVGLVIGTFARPSAVLKPGRRRKSMTHEHHGAGAGARQTAAGAADRRR